MQVVLPEVDGRILSRAVSFKAESVFDAATQCPIVVYRPVPDRIDFVAALAAGWSGLRATPAAERRVAILLANYPNRDGRLGNGVGLDTPAGTIEVLNAMAAAGYRVDDLPADGAALMARLLAGPTNSGRERTGGERLSLADYQDFEASLPAMLREQLSRRWGDAEQDPFFIKGRFVLPIHRFGHVVVAVQPARGYNIDPTRSYHDPGLVPPHGYLAFYAWLRLHFSAQAIIHMGKHGNLEWLPGKALALSPSCWPEAALGPIPHLYPFIVNDPGEGSQAKRRSAAVIVDHLTPPLTRAETYGPLRDLERLVDEYYEAAGLDPRRCRLLRDQILELAAASGLDKDCGITADEAADSALGKLDGHLCDLKELQIRDGLHVFGRSPTGDQAGVSIHSIAIWPPHGRARDQSRWRRTGMPGEATATRSSAWRFWPVAWWAVKLGPRGPGPRRAKCWISSPPTSGPGSPPAVPPRSLGCWRGSTGALSHRAPRVRLRADGPKCCRRGVTSIRWIHGWSLRRRLGTSVGNRLPCCSTAIARSMEIGPRAWRLAPGARPTCARVATISPRLWP
jgi:cobalamin biosynthesis Mg chelatase CobN